ncbi:UDP-2,3-diacylglucosamine diphosphatase [Halpernia frigidisoli]|uniref:UDP-2,3-diacylglucosamine pyrophosphatase LpxH n=1 Tax=Halpernia frigidisoli TaxID=1125876 RepID=A0A1I3FW38_9FLAO|nr:UDP-2,3-diacylglucosamine diphosphatase [Halpernia frigidisoli]SFI15377.1 UDP-2,3-diacylglucosamine pyrophosphatase LpxH [Halpernia frigidisoli]
MKRNVELVVISDVHLGTYGCKAKELLKYLNSINPKTLVLNGDIIDIWQFKKSYFPKSHLKVIKKIISFASKKTGIFYITGNHDEMFRKFTDFKLGKLKLCNKLCLELNGKKIWIFHGDVFDASVQHSKWLAKLGGKGYDLLILINTLINWFLEKMGKEKYSFSKKIKSNVKKAVKFIGDFELTASELAIDNGYDYVICGHIHQPQIREVYNKNGSCIYLNSGDWIENLSALEYNNGSWEIFYYEENKHLFINEEQDDIPDISNDELLKIVTQFA